MTYFQIKQGLDRAVAAILLILLFPLLLLLGILVRTTSPGPIFYSHPRLGLQGKEFQLMKFRTMKVNADELRKQFTPAQIEEFETFYKLKQDPRITPLGAILRKTSLDELPQLLNVLRGEMSLIGPRPIVADELAKYGKHGSLLLTVYPGISGLWQVKGRNDITYEERVALDMEYIEKFGFCIDLQVFFLTFREVFLRLGGY